MRERQTGGIPALASLSHSHKIHKTPSHSHVPQSTTGSAWRGACLAWLNWARAPMTNDPCTAGGGRGTWIFTTRFDGFLDCCFRLCRRQGPPTCGGKRLPARRRRYVLEIENFKKKLKNVEKYAIPLDLGEKFALEVIFYRLRQSHITYVRR